MPFLIPALGMILFVVSASSFEALTIFCKNYYLLYTVCSAEVVCVLYDKDHGFAGI